MNRRTIIILVVLAVLAVAGLTVATATVPVSWGQLKAAETVQP
jgi:hypothetical protein